MPDGPGVIGIRAGGGWRYGQLTSYITRRAVVSGIRTQGGGLERSSLTSCNGERARGQLSPYDGGGGGAGQLLPVTPMG